MYQKTIMRKITPEKNKNHETMAMPREMYPYFSISLKHLPEAKSWKVGKTYLLTLKLKQTGLSIRDNGEKENGDVTFDIVGVESKGESKGQTKRYVEEDEEE